MQSYLCAKVDPMGIQASISVSRFCVIADGNRKVTYKDYIIQSLRLDLYTVYEHLYSNKYTFYEDKQITNNKELVNIY